MSGDTFPSSKNKTKKQSEKICSPEIKKFLYFRRELENLKKQFSFVFL